MPQDAFRRSLILAPRTHLLAAPLAAQGLVARVIDGNDNAVDVGGRLITDKQACQLTVRKQFTLFKQGPYLLCEMCAQKLGRVLAESAPDIVHVAFQQR